ncbi:hypothetical protein [Kineococcus rhizosphaerae]|uniref:Uncharacterized protein n=1 Tax=Kineococcus rhizosphaerae TaxID=559628 RepID=A0A2T0R3W8_9ACTN|nr:hypothetical protein [Kineococcus rhizosphaerae]PRY14710.1 hypothetical protein CLV37_106269 [Kineococcus rhizosphaerae]
MKPLHQVLRDLELAAHRGTLTPSFLDSYARRNGEGVLSLYGLAARHGLPVAAEEGRNDQLGEHREWHAHVDASAVERDLDARSAAVVRAAHAAVEDDGRPAVLRKPTRNSFYPVKRAG